jgi:predicted O-methyltransferase YrrM
MLGTGVMHLRRIRVFGFSLRPPVVTETKPLDDATLAGLLARPVIQQALATTVESVVQSRVFGRASDSYNIDSLAFLTAAIDSGLYAAAHMANAHRFPHAPALYDFSVSCTAGTGMVLEFGVFSGRSINHIARLLPGRTVYGFDSFEGLPESWRPGFERGAFKRPDLPDVVDNVQLVVGWFNNTLPGFVRSKPNETLALLHVDCDLYSSTKTIFSELADRIVPGTIIIFDEYFNYPEWRVHEYKAFQELKQSRGISYEYIGVVPSHQQVAVRVTSVR